MEAIAHEYVEERLWVTVTMRGVAAAVFSIVALSNPWMPTKVLAAAFGGYVLVDGILTFCGSRRSVQSSRRRHLHAVESVISVVIAAIAVALPAAVPLLWAAGLRGILVGACEGIWALRRNPSERHWLLGFGGITSVLLGVLILVWPGPGSVALPWLIGLGAMVSGGLFVTGAMTHLQERKDAEEAAATAG